MRFKELALVFALYTGANGCSVLESDSKPHKEEFRSAEKINYREIKSSDYKEILELMEKKNYVKAEFKNKKTGQLLKEHYTFLNGKGDIEIQVMVKNFYSVIDGETKIAQIVEFYYMKTPTKTIITTQTGETTEVR